MTIQTILRYLARLVLFGAIAANLLAFAELIVQFGGSSLLGNMYTPGRLIELGAALLVLVIALLLLEILDELRAKT